MVRAVSRRDIDGVTRLKAPVLPAPQFQRDRETWTLGHLAGAVVDRIFKANAAPVDRHGLALDYSAPGTAQFGILFCWHQGGL
jgi:hypothetical protein